MSVVKVVDHRDLQPGDRIVLQNQEAPDEPEIVTVFESGPYDYFQGGATIRTTRGPIYVGPYGYSIQSIHRVVNDDRT